MDEHTNVLTPPPPPPPAGPPPRRRLTRNTEDGMIAGVAAGLGDYFDVDPVLFRVGFIALAFFFGLAIPLYLLAWIIVPPGPRAGGYGSPGAVRSVSRQVRQWPRWLAIAVVVVGVAVLFARIGPGPNPYGLLRPSIVWGIALVLLGVLLYRHAAEREAEPEPGPPREPGTDVTADIASAPVTDVSAEPPPPSPWATPGVASSLPVDAPATPSWATPTTPMPPVPPPVAPVAVAAPSPPRRRREHSPLGWITLGAALLAVGVAALLDQSGSLTIAPVRFPALALTLIGAGLLVGTVWGRGRWLIVFGVLLVPFVLAASLLDVPIAGGVGQRFYQPPATSQIPPAYRLAVGEMRIDLRAVVFDTSTATVTASVAVGQLSVTVPADTYVIVHAAVGAGSVRVLGGPFEPSNRSQDGVRVRLDQAFGSPTAANQLTLNLRDGFGQIDLIRVPSDQPLG